MDNHRTGTFAAAYLMSKGHNVKAALRKMKHTPYLKFLTNCKKT
jgi:protein-tyrosine phosphatase